MSSSLLLISQGNRVKTICLEKLSITLACILFVRRYYIIHRRDIHHLYGYKLMCFIRGKLVIIITNVGKLFHNIKMVSLRSLCCYIYIYASAEWTHHQQLQVAAAGFQENGARLLNADIVLYNMYAIACNDCCLTQFSF